MELQFLYEPYFVSLVVSIIFTLIFYFMKKNNKNVENETDTKKKKKQEMSPEIRSILIFISSYALFTGSFYLYKYYFPSTTNTETPNVMTLSVDENNSNNSILGETTEKIMALGGTIGSVISNIKESVSDKIETKNEYEEEKKRKYIDESLVAGKRKSPVKDKESLKHMNSKNAKFADHDVEFNLSAFNIK